GALKAEAGQLSHAIDALRQAPNDAKAPALEQLRTLACTEADTCSVQSSCVAAYELHLRALTSIDQSKHLVAVGDGGADLPALLGEAQQLLQRAKVLTQKCADAQGALVRHFNLR
ncbi:MAG TPA: hypothetical protein VGP93_17975, partial [Polyangiaceae bacterium]|nr:hypothetical protein [Polyangiaceae bacterium]